MTEQTPGAQKAQIALDHVRSLFPQVAKVTFNDDGWLFTDANDQAPSFHEVPINVSLLEDAFEVLSDADELPFTLTAR